MRQIVYLDGTETPDELEARGLSRTTIWRSLKRGWYFEDYHRPEIASPWGPAGNFGLIRDPYDFAYCMVRRALNEIGAPDDAYESLDDIVQGELLRLWERRHRKVDDPVAYQATLIIRHVKEMVQAEQHRRQLALKNLVGAEVFKQLDGDY